MYPFHTHHPSSLSLSPPALAHTPQVKLLPAGDAFEAVKKEADSAVGGSAVKVDPNAKAVRYPLN